MKKIEKWPYQERGLDSLWLDLWINIEGKCLFDRCTDALIFDVQLSLATHICKQHHLLSMKASCVISGLNEIDH